MTTPLVTAFENNLITLDQARIGMGLEPDPQFGRMYYFQLFGKIHANKSYLTKAVNVEQWEDWAQREAKKNQPIYDSFTDALIRVYDEWRRTTFGEKKANTDIDKMRNMYRVRLSEMKRGLREIYEQHAFEIMDEAIRAGKEALDMLGIDPKFDAEDYKKNIPNLANEFAEQRIGAFRDQLNQLAKKAKEEGWSKVQFSDGVREFINKAKNRAKTVSKTELAGISNQIKDKLYEESGVSHKIWYAKMEDRTCKYCRQMHSKIVAVGTPFIPKDGSIEVTNSNGKVSIMKIEQGDVYGPPIHPGCGCTMVPSMGDELPPNPFAKPDETKPNPETPSQPDEMWRPELFDDRTMPTESEQVMKIRDALSQIKGKPKPEQIDEIGSMIVDEIEARIAKDRTLSMLQKNWEQSKKKREEDPTFTEVAKFDLTALEQKLSQVRKEVMSEIRSMGLALDIPMDSLNFIGVSKQKREAWINSLDAVPTEWLARVLDVEKLDIEVAGYDMKFLGGYHPDMNRIRVRVDVGKDVFLHEFAHAITNFHPELFEMEKEYLLKRAGDEPIEKFTKLYPRHGYPKEVEGVKDQLKHPYAGRIYRNEKGEIDMFELLSLSFQAFFEGKELELVEDKDLEKFFLGLVATM